MYTSINSKLQNKTYRLNVIYLSVVGNNSLGISGDEWDKNPYPIACPNGIIDLRNGQFRDGHQDDYIKTVCPTEWLGYDEPAPRFERFLMEVFEGCREIISYLHKALGYGIAGLTIDHMLIILWGIGRNGKGVLIETLFHVLGPLAGPIQSEMLLEQKNPRSSAAPSPDLISLRGKRLVSASETDAGRRLNAAKVKYLVGGDTILAREPYGRREVSFRPSHTLLLLTNHRPKVSADDFALLNRLHLVPFTLSFVDHPTEPHHRKRNPQLLESLKEEASGILAWIVRGFKGWKNEGLRPPPQVIEATKEYQKNEDNLGKFIEACCVISSEARTKGGDLYKAYQKWCDSNGFKPMWGNKFGVKMAERFSKGKNGVYRGIGIKLEKEWGA
jgi:putative DNA primase/helicase